MTKYQKGSEGQNNIDFDSRTRVFVVACRKSKIMSRICFAFELLLLRTISMAFDEKKKTFFVTSGALVAGGRNENFMVTPVLT